jgi:hypothetical protein
MKRNELRSQQQLLLDVIEDECNHGSGVRIGRERRVGGNRARRVDADTTAP